MNTTLSPDSESVTAIPAQEALRQVQNGEIIQVIDVRSADEYAAGHIPGAMNVPLDEIENRLDDLSRLGPVLVVCQSGQRAEMACTLIGARHPGLRLLQGGTDAWVQAGGPLVSTRKARWSLERQVRLGAGLLVFAGVLLGVFVNPWWLILPGFVGAGLTFSGITGFCGMAKVLALMPWNRPQSGTPSKIEGSACCR